MLDELSTRSTTVGICGVGTTLSCWQIGAPAEPPDELPATTIDPPEPLPMLPPVLPPEPPDALEPPLESVPPLEVFVPPVPIPEVSGGGLPALQAPIQSVPIPRQNRPSSIVRM